METTSQPVDRSQQTARRHARAAAKSTLPYKRQLLRASSATWRAPSQNSTSWRSMKQLLGEWIDVVQLAGSITEAMTEQCSEPAKSAFFRLRMVGRMEHSTGLLPSSISRHEGSASASA
jgi:hypothetical protein